MSQRADSSVGRKKPVNVHYYKDRHGRYRYYFRKKGCPRILLPGAPGSNQFMKAYTEAFNKYYTGGFAEEFSKMPVRVRDQGAPDDRMVLPGSLRALYEVYKTSSIFANLKPSSKKTYETVLKPVIAQDGHRMVKDLTREKADKIIAEIGEKSYSMANLTNSILKTMFKLAVKKGWRKDNPFSDFTQYKLGKHHKWNDAELATYELRWPIGTRERLAYALGRYSVQRGSDIILLDRRDIIIDEEGHQFIPVVQTKTGQDEDDIFWIHIPRELQEAIDAYPTKGDALLGNLATGEPITRDAFTKLIKRAVAEAGLPERCKAHGLRKVGLSKGAEAGLTTKELQAQSGHRTTAQLEKYIERANRMKLSQAGARKMRA